MGIGDYYLKLFIYSLDFKMVISFNLVPAGVKSWNEVEFLLSHLRSKSLARGFLSIVIVTEHCIKVKLCLWRLIKVHGKMNWNEMQLVHTPRSKTE